jgi:hypothetical protein
MFAATALPAAVVLQAAVEQVDWKLMAVGAALALGACLIAALAAPHLIRPALTITREGVSTARVPTLPWQAIQGAHLEPITHKGRALFYLLRLFVPNYRKLVAKAHPVERLMYRVRLKRAKSWVMVALDNRNGTAEMSYEVLKGVWERSTGRRHFWHPDMSEEAARASARGSDSLAAIKRLARCDERDAVALKSHLESMETNERVVLNDFKQHMERTRRQIAWISGIGGVLLGVLLVAWLILSWIG